MSPIANRPLIPLDKFPPHLHKFLQEGVSTEVAKMLLSGLIPMDEMIKICCFYQLYHSHASLQQACVELAQKLSVEQRIKFCQARLPRSILDWLAEIYATDADASMGYSGLSMVW